MRIAPLPTGYIKHHVPSPRLMSLEAQRRARIVAERTMREMVAMSGRKVHRTSVDRKKLSLRDRIFPLRATMRRHMARRASYIRWKIHRHPISSIRYPADSFPSTPLL